MTSFRLSGAFAPFLLLAAFANAVSPLPAQQPAPDDEPPLLLQEPTNPEPAARQGEPADEPPTLLAQPGLQRAGADLTTRWPGFLGSSRSGFTSRFQPIFNPAFGVVFDVLGSASNSADPARDDFDLRNFEIDVASRIDPYGWAYAVVPFEVGADGERHVDLEEAAFVMDELPHRFSLRVGRYLGDFGKWNSLHLHDKPFVFQDGVRDAFFGGALNETGVELHQWTGIGDLPVRWSLGVAPRFGADPPPDPTSPGFSFTPFEAAPDGQRTPSDFAFTGRVTAQQDVGQNGYFQYGASVFHTPHGLSQHLDTDGDAVADAFVPVGQTTAAVDLTLRLVDATDRTADTFSVELWRNARDFAATATGPTAGRDANALWGFAEHAFSPYWAVGAMGAWWQDPGVASADWFTGTEAGSQQAVFLTWHTSEFDRIRLQLHHENPVGEAPSWTLALQWSVLLGSHSHPLEW